MHINCTYIIFLLINRMEIEEAENREKMNRKQEEKNKKNTTELTPKV